MVPGASQCSTIVAALCVRVLDEDNLNACTNEPSGEDLCVRSMAGCDKVAFKVYCR